MVRSGGVTLKIACYTAIERAESFQRNNDGLMSCTYSRSKRNGIDLHKMCHQIEVVSARSPPKVNQVECGNKDCLGPIISCIYYASLPLHCCILISVHVENCVVKREMVNDRFHICTIPRDSRCCTDVCDLRMMPVNHDIVMPAIHGSAQSIIS